MTAPHWPPARASESSPRERLGARARGVMLALVAFLIVANALNISADLVAVGSGMHLLQPGPTILWAILAGVAISALLLTGSFALVARAFKLLCAALLSYIAMLFMVKVELGPRRPRVVLPHLSLRSSYIALLVAILGTTISPYLFFWQGLHRLEEMRDEPEGGGRPEPLRAREDSAAELKLRTSRFDVFSGMAFSNIVMFAIIVATAATLGAHGRHNVQSAADAASALKPFAGRFASDPLRPRLHRCRHARDPGARRRRLAEPWAACSGNRPGFRARPRRAPMFYGLVLLGTLGGTALCLVGVNPIRFLVVRRRHQRRRRRALSRARDAHLGRPLRSWATTGTDGSRGSLGWTTAALMALAALVLFAFAHGGGLY